MPSKFSELGGDVIVSVDIGLDEEQILEGELALLNIGGYLENVEVPLFAARRIAMEDARRRFDTQSDPDGDPWAPLDEEYLRSKTSLGYPEDILRRTTDLEKAATSEEAFIITEHTLFFNTSVLPLNEEGESYGLMHQTGSGAENAGHASEHKARVAAGAYSDTPGETGHVNLGIGRGNALPRRAFIGLSQEAEAEIWTIFDRWFEDANRIAVNPRTGVAQERSSSGRFGKRIV